MCPKCSTVTLVEFPHSLRRGDDVSVVEIRKDGLAFTQCRLNIMQGWLLGKCVQGWHQRISLFAALALGYVVASGIAVDPRVNAWRSIKLVRER